MLTTGAVHASGLERTLACNGSAETIDRSSAAVPQAVSIISTASGGALLVAKNGLSVDVAGMVGAGTRRERALRTPVASSA